MNVWTDLLVARVEHRRALSHEEETTLEGRDADHHEETKRSEAIEIQNDIIGCVTTRENVKTHMFGRKKSSDVTMICRNTQSRSAVTTYCHRGQIRLP